jgi:hypothetical protein
MSEERTSALQAALEAFDQLSLEEKAMFFEITYRRFVEARRVQLAGEIAESRVAYGHGDISRGSLDDLMTESTG